MNNDYLPKTLNKTEQLIYNMLQDMSEMRNVLRTANQNIQNIHRLVVSVMGVSDLNLEDVARTMHNDVRFQNITQSLSAIEQKVIEEYKSLTNKKGNDMSDETQVQETAPETTPETTGVDSTATAPAEAADTFTTTGTEQAA